MCHHALLLGIIIIQTITHTNGKEEKNLNTPPLDKKQQTIMTAECGRIKPFRDEPLNRLSNMKWSSQKIIYTQTIKLDLAGCAYIFMNIY